MVCLRIAVALVAAGLAGTPAIAGDFDGSKRLICATVEARDCFSGADCFRGLPDEIVEIIAPEIQQHRHAGGMVAGFVRGVAYGAALALACECSPLVAAPTASIGHLRVRAPSWATTAASILENQIMDRMRSARPNVREAVWRDMADGAMTAWDALGHFVVDDVRRIQVPGVRQRLNVANCHIPLHRIDMRDPG